MLKPPSRMMVKTTGNLGMFSAPDPEIEVWTQYLHRGLVDFWLSSWWFALLRAGWLCLVWALRLHHSSDFLILSAAKSYIRGKSHGFRQRKHGYDQATIKTDSRPWTRETLSNSLGPLNCLNTARLPNKQITSFSLDKDSWFGNIGK